MIHAECDIYPLTSPPQTLNIQKNYLPHYIYEPDPEIIWNMIHTPVIPCKWNAVSWKFALASF